MKVLEKLEDYKLPDVGSAKVKECMQDAVERALQLKKKNEEAGENYPITVENFPKIFHTLSDCDFENEKCTNKVFKMIIDRVFVNITADEVLGVLNDAYAIAIDVMNTECPEYEVPKYFRFVYNHRRGVVEMEMVMACAIYVAYTNEIIRNVFDKYFEKTRYIEVFYITICRYVSFLYEHSKGRIDDSTFSSEELEIFNDLDSVLLPNYNDFYDFLDAIVRYAEELPADEWSAINAIGHMLQAKDAAGRYIPTEMYQEYEQRIGRLANYPKPKTGAKDGNEDGNAATGVEQGLSGEKKTSSADINEEAKTENPPKAPEKSYLKNNRNWLFAEHEDQIKWAEIFDEFIANRPRKIEREAEIGTEKGNFINKVLARFIYEWKSAGLLNTSRTKQSATVFLFESCKLKSRVDLDSHSNVVERLLAKGFKEEDKNDNLHIDVVKIMEQNK